MLPVINTPQVGRKKKIYSWIWEHAWQAEEERHLSAARDGPGFLCRQSRTLGSLGPEILRSESIQMIILSCRSPVQGRLLLPFLLFIKSWQLSHNFTLRLMENLSVEFMVLFGQPLNWERSPAQSPQCGKPFSQVFNTFWPWSVDECVCIWFASPIWRNQWKPGDVWA